MGIDQAKKVWPRINMARPALMIRTGSVWDGFIGMGQWERRVVSVADCRPTVCQQRYLDILNLRLINLPLSFGCRMSISQVGIYGYLIKMEGHLVSYNSANLMVNLPVL